MALFKRTVEDITLRSLIDAPWYVTNETIHRDFKIHTVKKEISKFSNRYVISRMRGLGGVVIYKRAVAEYVSNEAKTKDKRLLGDNKRTNSSMS